MNLGMNKTEFGKLFNTTGSLVNKWENKGIIPSEKRVKEIAKLGNITVEELLYGDTYFRKLELIKQTVKKAYKHIDDVDKVSAYLSEIEKIIDID
jgi:transcriptional regulator with XRE-family HTH domain